MADRRLRLGVAGLGRAAAAMLPSLIAHPFVDLVAAADPLLEARERFAQTYGGRVFATAEAMAAAPEIDAIYIATPHQSHAADVCAAAAHGKHALVEKPMALALDDCARMIAAADRAGTVLVVGHTHAFDPVVRAMRAIIASGELGALRMILNVAYTDFLYRPRRPEELDSALGGGIMYNQVPHQIEIVRALDGGPLRSIRAVAGVWDANRPTEGAMTAICEFVSGTAATLAYSGYDRFDSDELTFGIAHSGAPKRPNHGAARRALRGIDPAAEAQMKAKSGFIGQGVRDATGPVYQPHFGMLVASCERGDLRPSAAGVLVYDDAGVREIELPRGRSFPDKDGTIDEFYAAIVHGEPPLHDGRWGYATVEAALACVRSAAERREIVFDRAPYPQKPETPC